jgi:hypothetical protein
MADLGVGVIGVTCPVMALLACAAWARSDSQCFVSRIVRVLHPSGTLVLEIQLCA